MYSESQSCHVAVVLMTQDEWNRQDWNRQDWNAVDRNKKDDTGPKSSIALLLFD